MAQHFSALPGTVYAFDGLPLAPESAVQSMHRWWSPDFRAQLYKDLKPILDPPILPDDGVWGPSEVARVAGLGLVSSVREEIGFAVDLINKIEALRPTVVSLVIDDVKGVPFATVFRDVGHRARRSRFRLYVAAGTSRRGRLRLVRVPKWLLHANALAFGLRAAYRRTRRIKRSRASQGSADRAALRAEIAIYESNPKGWEYSRPVMGELRRRGRAVVEADPYPRVILYPRDGKTSTIRVSRSPTRSISTQAIRDFIRRALSSHGGQMIVTADHIDLTAQVLSRRIRGYLPGMGWSASAARLAVTKLGVQATLQEGHISPAARAFLLEAQRLGAHTFATHHGLFDPTAPERSYIASPKTILEWGNLHPAFEDRDTRICVVGNHLVERRMSDVIKSRHTKAPEPLVLVAFGRPGRIVDPEFFASSIRLVAAASNMNTKEAFVVNLHSGDSRGFWEVALSMGGRESRLTFQSGSIYELMKRASILVTNHSTAGAEALVCNIPVICITSHRDPVTGESRETMYTPSYLSDGAAHAAKSAEELSTLIDRIISSGGEDELAGARQDYAFRFLSRGMNRSGLERVAGVIEDVLSQESS